MSASIVNLAGEQIETDAPSVPDTLRKLADKMESGEVTRPDHCLMVCTHGDGMMLADSDGMDALRTLGLLECAKAALMDGD